MSDTATLEYIILWNTPWGAIIGQSDGTIAVILPEALADADLISRPSKALSVMVVQQSWISISHFNPPRGANILNLTDEDLHTAITNEEVRLLPHVAVFRKAARAVTINCGYAPKARRWLVNSDPIVTDLDEKYAIYGGYEAWLSQEGSEV